jgi:hypothetical protein
MTCHLGGTVIALLGAASAGGIFAAHNDKYETCIIGAGCVHHVHIVSCQSMRQPRREANTLPS